MNDGSLQTKVYRKPTHTDQYLHYESYQPESHKAAVVKTLAHRASNICSNDSDLTIELEHITQSLIKNGYPKHFIKKTFN